jgi:hypothetical protein
MDMLIEILLQRLYRGNTVNDVGDNMQSIEQNLDNTVEKNVVVVRSA